MYWTVVLEALYKRQFSLSVCWFFLYGIGFIAMFAAYKYDNVSKLQPILSVNYIFAVLVGYIVLGENITVQKLIGIVIITISVVAIASSKN